MSNPYYSDLTGTLQCTFIRPDGASENGDCTLITGEVNGLIDLGGDPSLTTVRNQIKAKGTRTLVGSNEVVKLDFVVLTHYHSDHVTSDISTALDNLILDPEINLDDCVFYLPHNGLDLTYTGSGENWSPNNTDFNIFIDDKTSVKYPRIKKLRDRQVACENKLATLYGASFSQHVKKPIAYNGERIGKTWREEAVTEEFNDHLKISFLNVDSVNYQSYYPYTVSNQNWANHGTNYNAFSMLTIIEHYNHKFVFSGDMVKPAQDIYARWVTDCDVYKVEHHGLEYNTSDTWLNALSPKYAVICKYAPYYQSGDFETRYPRDNEFTNRKTIQQLASKGAIILSTHDSQTIDINSTYEKLWVDTDVVSAFHLGPGYVNTSYPYYVAAMKRVTGNEGRVNEDLIIGGCTRYGNMVIVQMRLTINAALSGGSWYHLLSGLPKPATHKFKNTEYPFHAPVTVIKYGNNSKCYSGWINQYGNLCVGIFNSASSLAVGDNIFISGVYITSE